MNFEGRIILSGQQAVEFVNKLNHHDEEKVETLKGFIDENAKADLLLSDDCLFEVQDNEVYKIRRIFNGI